jgi:hypothetical protein
MTMQRSLPVVLVVAALVFTCSASAKEFRPGDLRICNSSRCVTIRDQRALDLIARFVYLGPQPASVRSVRIGVPYYELKFRNGYVPGIVATTSLDRFLSYGVYLERFRRGTWYRVPARAAQVLRSLTASLRPLALTRAAVLRSR